MQMTDEIHNPCIGYSKFSAGISNIWCAVYFSGDQQLFVHLADPWGAESIMELLDLIV